jgi:hemin uptake protein HemP
MSERADTPAAPQPTSAAAPAAAPSRSRPIGSEQLLQGRRLVEIEHNGEVYRLQATRLGKLILTK